MIGDVAWRKIPYVINVVRKDISQKFVTAPKSSDNSTSASILTTNNSENQTLASSQAFQLYPTLASMTSAAAGNLQKAVVTIGINKFLRCNQLLLRHLLILGALTVTYTIQYNTIQSFPI